MVVLTEQDLYVIQILMENQLKLTEEQMSAYIHLTEYLIELNDRK